MSSTFTKMLKQKENKTADELIEAMGTSSIFEGKLPSPKTDESATTKTEVSSKSNPEPVAEHSSNDLYAVPTQKEDKKDKSENTVTEEKEKTITNTPKTVEEIHEFLFSEAPLPEENDTGIKSTYAWNCRMEEEAKEKLIFTTYAENSTEKKILNSIIFAQSEFLKKSADVISLDYIKKNLIEKRRSRGTAKVRKSIVLTSDAKEILEADADKLGMSQTYYLECIILKYCYDRPQKKE